MKKGRIKSWRRQIPIDLHEPGGGKVSTYITDFTSIHARFEAARRQLELAELAQARGDAAGATTWLTEDAQALALTAVSLLGQYIFLVDINGHREEEHVAQALERLRERTGMLKMFGSYPRWQP